MRPIDVSAEVIVERDEFLASFKDKSQSEIFKACSEHPAVFAYYMLGVKVYGWQYLIIKDLVAGNRRIIMNTSRQIGKSMMSAIISLWFAVFNKGNSSEYRNSKIGIISATDDQSKKVMNDIRNLIWIGNAYCKLHYSKQKDDLFDHGLFSFLINDSREAENTKSAMTFKSWSKEMGILLNGSLVGSFIKSYPPTNIVRGETFDLLFVDEAAQIDDEIYNMAIEKTGDKYDAVRIMASTPYGMSGFFYELFDPDDKLEKNQWTRFSFTIDAIKLDVPLEYNKRMESVKQDYALGKTLKVRQENYCEFVQSEQSYFDPEKVNNIFSEDYAPVEQYSGYCDMGIDWGGLRKSQTVVTISTMDEDTGEIKRLFHQAYPVRQDLGVLEDVADLLKRFNIQRIIVDDCPEGDHMMQAMIGNYGWNVVGMKFGSEKVKKYGEFRSLVHKGKVKSYQDNVLMAEMKALMSKQGVERTKIQPPPGYSDDHVDSFLMSAYFYIVADEGFRTWDWDDL